jgi:hypothetical protein
VQVAVDSSGDVFVLDGWTGHVSKIVAVNGVIPASPTINVLANSYVFSGGGMVIDGNGNLFLTSNLSGSTYGMFEIPVSSPNANPTQLGGTFNTPSGVALDTSGNVYVCENGGINDIEEVSASSGYTTVTTPVTGLNPLLGWPSMAAEISSSLTATALLSRSSRLQAAMRAIRLFP